MRILKYLAISIICVGGLGGSAFAQKVVLNWNAVTPPANCTITAYNVYSSATAGGEVMGTHPLTPNGVTGTTFTDSTVAYGQTRYYKVSAWAGAPCSKESAFSNEVSATVPAQIIIVNAPVLQAPQVVIP